MIPNIKKYWKYALILLGGGLVILGYIFVSSWMQKRRVGGEGLSEGTEELQRVLVEIKDKMGDAELQANVEIAVAQGKETAAKEQLQEIVKIQDPVERRTQLAQMYQKIK